MREKQKPLLDLDTLYVIPTKEENVYTSLPDPKSVDEFEKHMKKIYNYENCECEYNDKCPEPLCYYCRINLENNKNVYFICGRRKDEYR